MIFREGSIRTTGKEGVGMSGATGTVGQITPASILTLVRLFHQASTRSRNFVAFLKPLTRAVAK
jgi:hypothetical protein